MEMVAKARKKLGLEDPLPPELLQGGNPNLNPAELKVHVTNHQKGSGILSGRPNPPSSSSVAAPSPAFFRPNIPLPPIAYRNAETVLTEKKASVKSSTSKSKSSKSSKVSKKVKNGLEDDFILKPSIPVAVRISANYKQQSKKERYANDDDGDDDGGSGGDNDRATDLRAGDRNINDVFESEYEKKLQADYEQLKSEFNEKLTKAHHNLTHTSTNTNTNTNAAIISSPSLSVNSVISSESPSTSQLPSVERRVDAIGIDIGIDIGIGIGGITDKEDAAANGGNAVER